MLTYWLWNNKKNTTLYLHILLKMCLISAYFCIPSVVDSDTEYFCCWINKSYIIIEFFLWCIYFVDDLFPTWNFIIWGHASTKFTHLDVIFNIKMLNRKYMVSNLNVITLDTTCRVFKTSKEEKICLKRTFQYI